MCSTITTLHCEGACFLCQAMQYHAVPRLTCQPYLGLAWLGERVRTPGEMGKQCVYMMGLGWAEKLEWV